jgi:hypothetical protein
MSFNISKILKTAKTIYDDICVQLIASDEIGQLVRLHYTPTFIPTTSTQYSDWGNSSFNGALNLTTGQSGQKQTEVTDEIRMRVYTGEAGFSWARFRNIAGLQYTEGQILTIGLMSDYAKVVDCVKADFFITTENTTGVRPYKLATEVRPHGFGKDTFFFCFWDRVI